MAPEVIVIWGLSRDGSVSVLSYGDGSPRIYKRDKLDARLVLDGEVLPYFGVMKEAASFLLANPSKQVQLALTEARKYGLA